MKKTNCIVINKHNIELYRNGLFHHKRILWYDIDLDYDIIKNFPNIYLIKIIVLDKNNYDIDVLKNVPLLKVLIIKCCEKTHIDLDPIKYIENLNMLDIHNMYVQTLDPILECFNLKCLKLKHIIGYENILNLDRIDRLEKLEKLIVNDSGPIDELKFKKLASMKNLIVINAKHDNDLVPMPKLIHLNVKLNYDEMAVLLMFPKLKSINVNIISDKEINMDWLSYIPNTEKVLIICNSYVNMMKCPIESNLKNIIIVCYSLKLGGVLNQFTNLRSLNIQSHKLDTLKNIGNCKSLKFLKITQSLNDNILYESFGINSNISFLELKECTKIEYIIIESYSFNDCESLKSLVNLKHLVLINTKITSSDFLGEYPKMKLLHIKNSPIDNIDTLIAPNLVRLDVSNTNITNICFEHYPKIKYLNISSCHMQRINGLEHLNNLKILISTLCGLKTLDNLESSKLIVAYVLDNELKSFPFEKTPNIIRLNCGFNNLTTIDGIESCHNITKLNICGNAINDLRPVLSLLHLEYFRVDENIIRNQDPRTRRILERYVTRTEKIISLYHDKQNVHDSTIQKYIIQSVNRLLNDPIVKFDLNSIINSSLSSTTIERIIEYSENNMSHSIFELTFSELFAYVWARIERHENRTELYKILEEQILDSECMCFTGRFNRLISVLVGFYDDIQINISDSSRISAIIIQSKNDIVPYDPVEHRIKAKLMLTEIGYNEQEIEPWIEAIDTE